MVGEYQCMKNHLWLHRSLISGPYLCLVRSQKDFDGVIKQSGVTDPLRWLGVGASATTTSIKNLGNERITIVSLNPGVERDHSPIQIAALLCHEAVHVVQHHCHAIGEDSPSDEFEAYAIEQIALRLMFAYTRELAQEKKDYPSTYPPARTTRAGVGRKKKVGQ